MSSKHFDPAEKFNQEFNFLVKSIEPLIVLGSSEKGRTIKLVVTTQENVQIYRLNDEI